MKLLVSIANWHTNRDDYLTRIIKEYRSLHHVMDVDIVVYSRVPKKIAGAKVVQGYYEGTDFTWCGRKEIISAIDYYDLFIHTDDDVLIRRETVLAFLEETRRLPERFISTLVIAEKYKNQWYALNHHREWPTADACYWIGDRCYYVPRNRHWAGMIATQYQLRKAIKSGGFCTEPTEKPEYGMRAQEYAMSNIYFGKECGMLPVIPVGDLNTFKAEHLDRKYARSGVFLTLEEVRERALKDNWIQTVL